MPVTITFRGRPVYNPILRVILGITYGFAGVLMGITGGLIGVATIFTAPVWLPAHFLLRLFGRQGFIDTRRGFKIQIGPGIFKRWEY